MDVAAGKYLFFLDSDDMIHPQLLEALYELQEEKRTVIGAEGWYEAEDGEFSVATQWERENQRTWKNIYLNSEKALKYCLIADTEVALHGIGGKMILKEAVESLQFDEELVYGEDALFLYQLIKKGADVSVLFFKWYYYRLHETSTFKTLSLEFCRCRYKIMNYIREDEIQSGKMANAIGKEWVILSDIIEWHEIGRKNRDYNLVKVTELWFDTEKKMKIFLKMKWWNKLEIYLGIYCYPIYSFIHIAVSRIKKYDKI